MINLHDLVDEVSSCSSQRTKVSLSLFTKGQSANQSPKQLPQPTIRVLHASCCYSCCKLHIVRAVKQDFLQKKVLEDVEKVLKRFTASQSRIKLQTRLI